MINLKNQNELLNNQYNNTNKLDVRIYLHERFSTNSYGWFKWVFDQLQQIPPNSKILELGCGNGGIWEVNLKHIPEDWEIILSDFSEGMLKKANENLSKVRGRFQYKIIDAQSIDYEDNSFDVVIANHMLYHIPDLDLALSEIKRVLKQGGLFFATTMGITNLKELKDLLLEFDQTINYSIGSAAKEFGLETGSAKLLSFYNELEIRKYEDSLEITEALPLVDYVLSFSGVSNINEIIVGQKLSEFHEFIENKINESGKIHVSKDSGILIAR